MPRRIRAILLIPFLTLAWANVWAQQPLPANANPAQPPYKYRHFGKELLAIYRQPPGLLYLGHLDAKGNFVEDRQHPPRKPNAVPFSIPPFRVINYPTFWPPANGKEPVFEYRSGALIKGHLYTDGNFVPEVGSRVIRFEDYREVKDAPRIYNLPGKFVPKD